MEAQVHLVFVNEKGKPIKIPEEIYSKFKIKYEEEEITFAFLNKRFIISWLIILVLTFLGLG